MMYPVSQLSRSLPKCVPLIRRNLLTLIEEPVLTSLVPERPCTIVLAEDEGFYSQSWNTWRSTLVDEHGFSFAHLSITADDFDAALRELSNDLSHLIAPHTVLLSRGPMISWLAQFYLESLPIKGLIMVDPLPMDHGESVQALERHYATSSASFSLFHDYVEHYAHWTMKLEPGSVPMMILTTPQIDNDIFGKGALRTKVRHEGDGMYVSLVKGDDEVDLRGEVIRWITDEVL